MRVLFVTPEMDDFVQVGGLAAVSATLPRALQSLCDVRVIIPGYREVLAVLRPLEFVADLPAMAGLPACAIRRGTTHDGLPVYVVDCPQLYDRDGTPYSDNERREWLDNDIRFARFASAAANVAAGAADAAWHADVAHCHDWASALVPTYLAGFHSAVPAILTIHSLIHQGSFNRASIARIGTPDNAFSRDDMAIFGEISFLKSGLMHASHLTTVSGIYAREITTAEYGCGLENMLRRRADKHELSGILNGIDESWNPQTCVALATPFAAGDWAGKSANANHVRKEFGLAASGGPLFAVLARLVHQKGVDLVVPLIEDIVRLGGQIIFTGRGHPQLEKALQKAQARNPENVAALIRFDNGEARRILAGSDFTLLPSRFEPCGLSQMYAQRFGSLPIGRQTGGLSETIIDGKTGFLFPEASPASLMSGISRALSLFGQKQVFNTMREQAMSQDFSWRHSAIEYVSLYAKVAVS